MNYPTFFRIILLVFALSSSIIRVAFATETGEVKVRFTSSDNIILRGLYRAPASPEKATVIMLHGLGSTKEEWDSFAAELVRQGCGVLRYDARGHGESTATGTSGLLDYKTFGSPGPASQWERMIGDLTRATRFLTEEKKIPQKTIVYAGASLGANICLVNAATSTEPPAVIALSPGIAYAGIDTRTAAQKLAGRRVALVVSRNDLYAWKSSLTLYRLLGGGKETAFFEGAGGHGVQMFNGTLEKSLAQWAEGAVPR